MDVTHRIRVVHLGPSRRSRGGMAAVIRDLEASPLAARHAFEFIDTWRDDAGRLAKLVDFSVALLRLALWCLRPGARVVHVHTAVRGSWYRKAVVVGFAHALRRPVILQVHSGAGDIAAFWERLGPWRRRMVARAFARADRVVSVSDAGASALRRFVGLRDVVVVRNAAPHMEVADAAAGSADGPLEVLYLGGFANPAKGGAVLVDALPELLADGDVSVTLAGPGEPPPAAAKLLADGSNARWAGWLDDDAKAAALARAGVVVFPSISEGLPIALLESMVTRRAIVAARTGGMPEVLTDGEDALMVPPGDPSALASAVRAVAADPALRDRLGRAAAARASRLNRDEVYRPLERLYATLGAPGRSDVSVTPATAIGDGHAHVNGNGRNGHGGGRALLVCSPGGHLQQMLALKPAWERFDVSWATLEGADVEHLLAGEEVAFGHGPTNRSIGKLLRNLVFAARLLRERRPDVILSTGAGLAVPIFLVGRLRGVRLVYVESLTRTEGLSLSGRLAAPLAHEVFVQWPQAVEGRARYVGSILTEPAPEPQAVAGPR